MTLEEGDERTNILTDMQFLFSPAFVAAFFASLLTLEGRPKDIVPKLKQVRLSLSCGNEH